MAPIDKRKTRGGAARATARYALVCVAIGAAVSGVVLVIVDGAEREPRAPLPPVRETQLVRAVQLGGCELRRARRGEQLRPAVDGPRAAPARPGFYAEAPPARQLTGALRRGVIVISYRPGLERKRLAQLRSLQTVVPSGTIVTPDTSAMPYEVAVAAYRRLLGCQRFTDAAIDAIRLFRGRHIGIGPDR